MAIPRSWGASAPKPCSRSSDPKADALVKSRISDGFVTSPRSRLANPENKRLRTQNGNWEQGPIAVLLDAISRTRDVIVFKTMFLARPEGGSRINHTATTDNAAQKHCLEYYRCARPSCVARQ
ncbi:hypothetical protein DESC_390033 [Desulfosarcina cetonica]|nr:hypothetical protein DESC_390033 [Desulfosarcina cetonica]